MWAVAAEEREREREDKLRKRLGNIYTQLARKTESIIEDIYIYIYMMEDIRQTPKQPQDIKHKRNAQARRPAALANQ